MNLEDVRDRVMRYALEEQGEYIDNIMRGLTTFFKAKDQGKLTKEEESHVIDLINTMLDLFDKLAILMKGLK